MSAMSSPKHANVIQAPSGRTGPRHFRPSAPARFRFPLSHLDLLLSAITLVAILVAVVMPEGHTFVGFDGLWWLPGSGGDAVVAIPTQSGL